jgi:hypothetical protein
MLFVRQVPVLAAGGLSGLARKVKEQNTRTFWTSRD